MENLSAHIQISLPISDKNADRDQVIDLVLDAGKGFYNVLFPQSSERKHYVERLLDEPESEAGNIRFLIINRHIQGIYIAFPYHELAGRQIISFRLLMEEFKGVNTIGALHKLKNQLPPITQDCYYLSKIAVAPNHRNKGIGKVLMKHFEQTARGCGYVKTALHVAKSNITAIRFYESLGYTEQKIKTDHEFQIMDKFI